MATAKTFVPVEKLEAVLKQALNSYPQLSIETKARWIKVQGPGGKLYLPKAKKVGTIHVSGFTIEGHGVRTFDKDEMPTGKVTQELDFRAAGATEDSLCESFASMLTLLSETVKPVKAAPPSAPEAPLPADSSAEQIEETAAA